MDECVTCHCGNQSWVIGTSGIRCSKCGQSIDGAALNITIDEANERVAEKS